jgi:hypothetical protein
VNGTSQGKWLPQYCEEMIPPFTSLFDAPRLQGYADPFRSVVREVCRVVTPPTPVVVPEVVVRIGPIDSDRKCFVFHMRFPVVQTHQGIVTPEDKKAASCIRKRLVVREDYFSGRFALHIEPVYRLRHRG